MVAPVCAWHDALVTEPVAVPVVVIEEKLCTFRVRFSDDLSSSSSVSHLDIGLDEASTQWKLEQKWHEVAMFLNGLTTAIPSPDGVEDQAMALHVAAYGFELPPVAVLGYEEAEDSEEDSEENSLDTEDFLALSRACRSRGF
ncbi:hypothetical protein FNV43_RR17066 [Rhamnella rubrinervis]|uniref:Uncharacterized protein n=1 Tax=Rhamnella rubrinervis TaxID=2594499 RepID=A0A8K0H009_9ROSA|nr:hypothetical protein FNV43_RR17066 [Rhamnella rubrinervis]